jgi:hypothetical protein
MATLDRGSLWLRHAFLLPTSEDQTSYGSASKRRYATSAAFKFTNTSLGGNFAINNPPQFTPYADIYQPGRGRTEAQRSEGMGRYYSEAIDDPKQVIHMSFGVPKYSSWTSFFTNFYDRNAALLANTGRVSDLWYNLGAVGGYVVSLPLQPFIVGLTATARVYNFLARNSPSKWYYFSPTMHAYWSAVNTIANEMAIGLGIIPRVIDGSQQNLEDPGQRITDEDLVRMHNMFPDLFREPKFDSAGNMISSGGIDVMALANRTQRMSDHSQQAMRQMREKAQNLDELRERTEAYLKKEVTDPNPNADARKYFQDWIKAHRGENGDTSDSNSFGSWKDLSMKAAYDFMVASQRDGSQFATFRVNHNGTVSESFSNSTRESEVASMLNTKVQQGRSASFNLMGGNVTSGVGMAMDYVKSFMAGALDSVNLGGLATLTGTAFVDVPKYWDGSTANLPRAEYTIPLISPYGNKISRFINLFIPIAMLLAGALPRSAGRSAYTSPFICQIYHQGRVQCQLGIVDSLSISRGTGNVGWNADGDMLGAEITISVVDLSSILHIPVKAGFASGDIVSTGARAGAMFLGELAGDDAGIAIADAATGGATWDEQSLFSDYMAVLTSMPLSDSYYLLNRLNVNMTRATQSFKNWKSPSNFMSWALDSGPARAISAFAQTTNRF